MNDCPTHYILASQNISFLSKKFFLKLHNSGMKVPYFSGNLDTKLKFVYLNTVISVGNVL